ncbi:MAG: glucose-6-phosphate isomerase, partial [Betaproteobacteria bacterium]|nr:glucose-6-phosphate isomerase [Betaproteobacteria bacterium]
AEQLRARADIDDVVHIGIGGSSLGPEMALQALKPFHSAPQRIHVVSNLDGHDLHQILQELNPHRTLLVVVSKSWSTAETLRNAESAIAWLRDGGVQDVGSQMVAVSSKPALAQRMGAGDVLDMPEGMGGRYSLWSSVGLPVALALGAQGFMQLLQGGADMDDHFALAPLPQNVPVLLGLLDVWNSTLLGFQSRCVVPHHHGLRRLPAYLQQLEMESNGKRVDLEGRPLPYCTAGVTWGAEGSNSQHAFFQWLHQGTHVIPLELLLVKEPEHSLQGHHRALLANGLAQAQALMQGQEAEPGQLAGHQDFPGNRPSTIIGLERLTPASLGALLAMYEHRTFVAGVMWGINSFDQFGVELGKSLATELESRLQSGDTSGLDASTAYWVNWFRSDSCTA